MFKRKPKRFYSNPRGWLTREKGRGVPMVVFTKVEAKDIGDNLCGKDIKISNAHPPTERERERERDYF